MLLRMMFSLSMLVLSHSAFSAVKVESGVVMDRGMKNVPGASAPFFRAKNIEGEVINSQLLLKQKGLYLLFFAPYGPEGVAESIDLFARYHQSIEFVAVIPAMNSTLATVKQAVKDLGIQYQVIFDENHQLSRLFDAWHHPTRILIGRDGKVMFYSKVANVDIDLPLQQLSQQKNLLERKEQG